jgi:flavin-dependent dehydrogenase
MSVQKSDVAIVGAGPGGSTCGAFLKKYNPGMTVSIYERENFPRDHVGESLLPMVGNILHELGVWDRIESAGFPIKVGGTYRWGNTSDLWDFNFLPRGELAPEPRPAKYEGQRRSTAFQVDRAIYDKILADYAGELGCQVSYGNAVREVRRKGDEIESLALEDGTEVQAKFYIDASGHSGIIRRAMGVRTEEPALLRNIAVWDYWNDADWAVRLGIGGTRIQVLSLGYGWIWFIQIGDSRTSVGFVCPAQYYLASGVTVEQLYTKALSEEPRVCELLSSATQEHRLTTTKDWSFISQRMSGENWFLAGESQGFADPILSAGLTLTHTSAREVAYIILEAQKGGSLSWLRQQYESRNSRRIRQHIKFADYWYTGNGNFNDLRDYVSTIAADAGLDLDGEKAFQWLGTGGFIEEDMGVAGLATLRIDQVHQIGQRLSHAPPVSSLNGFNLFLLDLKGAEETKIALFESGRITAIPALRRDGKLLPLGGYFSWVIQGLRHSPQLEVVIPYLAEQTAKQGIRFDQQFHARITETLEAMARDGWIKRKRSASAPPIDHQYPYVTAAIRPNVPGQ